MKKNTCIVMGSTKNYISQLAVVLLTINQYSPNFADNIIIFHDGISNDQQQKLKLINNEIEFITYYDICKKYLSNEILSSYSELTFSRFECFNLLSRYETVIWLDLDIIIKKDISDLINYGKKSGIALSVNDCNLLNIYNFNKSVPNYSMFAPLYNAGMIVLHDTLNGYEKMTDWCYKKTEEISSYLKCGEQGIINLLLQEFNVTVEEIDILKYVCHPDRAEVDEASIVHSYGIRKFWNDMERDLQFPEWGKLVRKWNLIGWTQNKAPKISVVMTVYKRTEYLETAINSILSQTLGNFEFIIVVEKTNMQDDIVHEINLFNDPRIVVICNTTKLGFAESLNVGLNAAKGEYVARFDDDDYSVLERFQVQADYLDSHNDIDIVGSYIKCFDKCEDVWDKISIDDSEIKVRLLSETQIYHPTAMMRLSSLRKFNLNYPSEYFTEDYALWAKAVEKCKFANIPQILVRYRASGTNATSNNHFKIVNSHIDVMRYQFEKYLRLNPSYDELMVFSRSGHFNPSVIESTVIDNLKDRLIDKMISSNNKLKFYDHNVLRTIYKKSLSEKSVFESIISKCKYSLLMPIKNIIKNIIYKLTQMSLDRVIQLLHSYGILIIEENDFLSFKDSINNRITNINKQMMSINNQMMSMNDKIISTNNDIKDDYHKIALQHEIMDKELHYHIDFVQRDALIVLNSILNRTQPEINCITDYPVAIDSPDHIHPIGTLQDHTRCPRFIRACESLIPNKKRLSFLDLGCSSGGIVWDAILRGHIAIGLEGSNLSLLQQRAEWRLVQDELFTCDIGKPFELYYNDGRQVIFDIISAFEVLEHLTEDSLRILFINLSKLMNNDSYFICTISQVGGGSTDDGIPLHQTIKPLAWWRPFFNDNGFTVVEPCPINYLDFARGNGNPSIYYKPLTAYHENPNDCLLLVLQKI